MHLAAPFGVLLLVGAAGCGPRQWRAYPGAPRHAAEVSRLSNEVNLFTPSAAIRSFDGVPLTRREELHEFDIELLPGDHRLEVAPVGMYVTAKVDSSPLELHFAAAPARRYVVRVRRGDGGRVADAYGQQYAFEFHWIATVVDESTGEVMSDVRPLPGHDRAW